MTHAFYIVTAYAVTAAVVLSLIAWTFFDGRARRRELAELDAKGLRRRGTAAPGGAPSP
ncbi:heme exporter protein CcmD [Rhizobium sp. SL86]|jgi:heme exporter protein D|uniref:heme exporter protein CcmD n=1 Tax=Rhizobium sp. SL86 TaxID=2995148 RepID=UPI002275C9E6|nr:heme exporter protein CcmD [Rhizobium sp. SL86]MCY1665634.1 heme exporter protein CcmD [Rhizobium sp. SL86]